MGVYLMALLLRRKRGCVSGFLSRREGSVCKAASFQDVLLIGMHGAATKRNAKNKDTEVLPRAWHISTATGTPKIKIY